MRVDNRIIVVCVPNLPINLGVSETFRSPLMVGLQQLSDCPLDPATFTFHLGGHGACAWYGSLCSFHVPSVKFVGLPFGRYYALPVSALVGLVTLTFDLWSWNWCALPLGWTTFLPIFGVSRTFRYRLIGQHLSDESHDLETLIFDLGGHGASRWYGSSCSVCEPSLKFIGLPGRKIFGIYCVNINGPGELDLWPFDL